MSLLFYCLVDMSRADGTQMSLAVCHGLKSVVIRFVEPTAL
ncbi:MAG TPA: hypothetical protein VFD29_08530 [Gillisia sp.]|nr:hypothetical protein [Gillisia sp.]